MVSGYPHCSLWWPRVQWYFAYGTHRGCPSPATGGLSLEEVLARARQGRQRLIAAGLPTTRNIKRRLAWKRARGIDTTEEERFCGL